MADFKLEPYPFLWGKERYFGKNYQEIVFAQSIVSMAIPRGKEENFSNGFTNAFGTPLPEPGRFVYSNDDELLFLWMSTDQVFVLFKREDLFPEVKIQTRMEEPGFLTDQTDNWCQIRLIGPDVNQALTRICPLDLDLRQFPVGGCARTVMEHLGSVIIRESEEEYLLLSPSSSSESFLEAIEQSFNNIGDF